MTVQTTVGNINISDSMRQKCEVFDRVTGYYRPISEFNKGKKQEEKDKVRFSVSSLAL